ncbi:hypothetical protein HQ865_07790 [Mucilaginibacter mali]|uniref:Lipoprotein n=1 Tax=Mucilaginibacter mali TaxID=2740462 RepID=A0A7D4UA64_9SPHI|nr:hypothetical protein [Mucilaginibacter mali]QKJ29658.1 hypothetical protein HQ865_07790 [Mucilaginibacter mali]
MKKFRTPALVLLLALAACQKSNDTVSTPVTNAEVADMVASSLSANSSGLIMSTADITVNAQSVFDLNIGCGNTKNFTATHTSPANANISYSDTFSYGYTLNCNANNQPDNITGTASEKGTFDGPRSSATNTGTATFRVAGLTPAATVYVINGEFKRVGTFASKVESKNTSTTTVTLAITNLTINKSTKVVTSGSATVTVNGTTTKNAAINFTGNATFTGDGKATITLNGTVYIVDLLTGDFTKK